MEIRIGLCLYIICIYFRCWWIRTTIVPCPWTVICKLQIQSFHLLGKLVRWDQVCMCLKNLEQNKKFRNVQIRNNKIWKFKTIWKVKPLRTQELSPYKDSKYCWNYANDLKTLEHQTPLPSGIGGTPKKVTNTYININLNLSTMIKYNNEKIPDDDTTHVIIYLKESIFVSTQIWDQPLL